MKRHLLTAVAAVLVLSACGSGEGTGNAAPSPSSAVRREPAITPSGRAVATPVRVSIPRIGVTSRLDRLALEPDGTLQKPPRWQVAGWYADGPRPGADGPAVVAGHVDSPTGPAVFARLAELRPGDTVLVQTATGTGVTFRVDRLVSAPRARFPTAAVYGPTPDAQLRLITCDGVYDRTRDGYQDNLVVFATAVSR